MIDCGGGRCPRTCLIQRVQPVTISCQLPALCAGELGPTPKLLFPCSGRVFRGPWFEATKTRLACRTSRLGWVRS